MKRTESAPFLLPNKKLFSTLWMQSENFWGFADERLASTSGERKQNFFLLPFKGRLILKCLFGFFNSPKKQTKTIRLELP